MDERLRFVAAVKSGTGRISALCRIFGISRKTAYKWLNRYEQKGPEGLEELSRARHFHPNATSQEPDLLLELRRARPPCGLGVDLISADVPAAPEGGRWVRGAWGVTRARS